MRNFGFVILFSFFGIFLTADILNQEIVSLIVALVLLAVVLGLILTKRFVSSISWLVPIMLLLYGAGSYLHLFERVNNYDKLVHTYSAFLVTYIIAVVYRDMLAHMQKKNLLWYLLAVASFGIAVGALWEIFEYFIQFPVHAHLNLGTFDTITDLIADTVGAVIGSIVSWRFLRKN